MDAETIGIVIGTAIAVAGSGGAWHLVRRNGKGTSVPPKADLRAEVATNTANIRNLTDICNRQSDLSEKLFDKIDSLEEKIGVIGIDVAVIKAGMK